MKLQSILVSNFKSFHGEHLFDFSALSQGLYLLSGKNLVEPALGSNGSGKSTIWEAWHWGIFGRTQRNLKAGDIACWLAPKAQPQVQILWEQDGHSYGLIRTWNPNSLLLFVDDEEEKDVTQQDVQELIRITPAEFANCYFQGQGVPHFFDGTPSQKMEILQDALDLKGWEARSKVASTQAKQLDIEKHEMKEALARIEGKIELLDKTNKAFELQQEVFEKEKLTQCKVQEREVKRFTDQVVSLQQDVDGIAEVLKTREQELVQYEATMKTVIEEEGIVRTRKEEAQRDLAGQEATYKIYTQQLQEFLDLDTSQSCPTCYQVIKKTHVQSIHATLQTTIEEQATHVFESKEHAKQLVHDYKDIQQALTDKQGTLREHQEYIRNVLVETNTIKSKLMTAQHHAKREQQIFEELKQSKLDDTAYQANVKTLSDNVMLREHNQAILKDLEQRHHETEYWIKGFKSVRLFLMDQAVTQLEIEVNMALSPLGLDGWTITLEVEKETKSGTISKGFQVMIQPPGVEKIVPWEAYSGGESQRLRLAGRIGLSNLILNNRGLQTSIEVWDEPTAHLSPEGVEQLIEVLREQAEIGQKQIWLVDHRSYESGAFTGTWTVVKEHDGSHLNV
jgi:DNA repair exonuclease SbcCD ATPase subunit